MYLFLDKSICSINFTENVNLNTLENIIQMGIKGSHILSADRETLQFISSIESLGSRHIGYINHNLNNLSLNGAFYSSLKKKIIIDGDIEFEHQESISGNWRVPFKFFTDFSIGPTVLLCENIVDCHVLEHAANHFRLLENYAKVPINCDFRAGGGSTTYQTLKYILNSKSSFCLCINDSDKLFPDGAYGTTHQKCLEILKANIWNISLATTLGRELENDIPRRFIESAYASHGEVLDNLHELSSRLGTNHDHLWPYLDLKHGFTLRGWLNLRNDRGHSEEWNLPKEFIESHHDNNCEDSCMDLMKCSKNDQKCTTKLLPKISANLLGRVQEWLDSSPLNQCKKLINLNSDNYWLYLGQVVFEHCCCERQYRL